MPSTLTPTRPPAHHPGEGTESLDRGMAEYGGAVQGWRHASSTATGRGRPRVPRHRGGLANGRGRAGHRHESGVPAVVAEPGPAHPARRRLRGRRRLGRPRLTGASGRGVDGARPARRRPAGRASPVQLGLATARRAVARGAPRHRSDRRCRRPLPATRRRGSDRPAVQRPDRAALARWRCADAHRIGLAGRVARGPGRTSSPARCTTRSATR